jgi:hypothetical protein
MSNGFKSFLPAKENAYALSAKTENERFMHSRPQMCLRCQKDKYLKGGSIKFICKDCLDAKQQEKNT